MYLWLRHWSNSLTLMHKLKLATWRILEQYPILWYWMTILVVWWKHLLLRRIDGWRPTLRTSYPLASKGRKISVVFWTIKWKTLAKRASVYSQVQQEENTTTHMSIHDGLILIIWSSFTYCNHWSRSVLLGPEMDEGRSLTVINGPRLTIIDYQVSQTAPSWTQIVRGTELVARQHIWTPPLLRTCSHTHLSNTSLSDLGPHFPHTISTHVAHGHTSQVKRTIYLYTCTTIFTSGPTCQF